MGMKRARECRQIVDSLELGKPLGFAAFETIYGVVYEAVYEEKNPHPSGRRK